MISIARLEPGRPWRLGNPVPELSTSTTESLGRRRMTGHGPRSWRDTRMHAEPDRPIELTQLRELPLPIARSVAVSTTSSLGIHARGGYASTLLPAA